MKLLKDDDVQKVLIMVMTLGTLEQTQGRYLRAMPQPWGGPRCTFPVVLKGVVYEGETDRLQYGGLEKKEDNFSEIWRFIPRGSKEKKGATRPVAPFGYT